MAKKDGVVFDTRAFNMRINLYDKKSRAAAKEQLKRNALDLERHAQAMAPLEEGSLTGGINAKPTIKEDGIAMEAEVHAGTDGMSAPYALRMHESMWPAIPTSDKRFMPGPLTSGKPGDAAGPAGGKYLTRPLLFYMKRWSKEIADQIKRVK